jgi:hypothetical protein
VGKEKCFLIFYSGTECLLHDWGYFESSPPPTTPKQYVEVSCHLRVESVNSYLKVGGIGRGSGVPDRVDVCGF